MHGQRADERLANGRFVIDHQHQFPIAFRDRRGVLFFRHLRIARGGTKTENVVPTPIALCTVSTPPWLLTMPMTVAVRGPSLPHFLRREKRIEDFFHDLGRHAAARVDTRSATCGPSCAPGFMLAKWSSMSKIFRRDRERAAPRPSRRAHSRRD